MNTKTYKYFIPLLIAGISLFSGCLKTKSLSPIPEISYNSFVKGKGDTAILSINFKDGDGDIGVNQDDTTNNLFLIYYYKGLDGNFHRDLNVLIMPDSIMYIFLVPNVTPKGQNKVLEGEIKVKVDPPYHDFLATPKHTLVKYKIYLLDRAGNKSNVIESEEIPIP